MKNYDYSNWVFSDEFPIYLQLYQWLKCSILSGQLSPNEIMPSIRELATALHINNNTVARSFRLLHREGLIHQTRCKRNRVVSDADFIHKKRSQESQRIYQNFMYVMMELGFSVSEIMTFLLEHMQPPVGEHNL